MTTPTGSTEDPRTRRKRRKPPRRGKENGFKRVAMLWVGWGFIVLGVLGTFLPILQGFLFFAIGLVILARRSPRVRLVILKIGRRYPRFRKGLEDARKQARRMRRRIAGWFRRSR